MRGRWGGGLARTVSTLPPAARRLLVVLVALAGGMAAAAAVSAPHRPSAVGVAVLATGMIAGEAFRIPLPYRRGGKALFTLSDAALTAGLLLLPPADVVIAAFVTMLAWQLFERVAPVKLVFNTAQYVTGAAAAALVVQAAAPRPGALGAVAFGAAGLGLVLFLGVNTVSVAGIIATTGGEPFSATARRLAPTAALLAAGNACLGLLALVLARTEAWALPALCVPLVVLYTASRQDIGAKITRERSAAFVSTEQRLSEATLPEEVSAALVAGVGAILGCAAAVWSAGRWTTPVPEGSGPCPVDPDLARVLVTRGPALGPRVEGSVAAVGVGSGVLVAWSAELTVTAESEEWLARLSRSGRASYGRAAATLALHSERATLRAVVDGTGDGILVLDGDGIVRLWNPAMARLAGTSADAALGASVAAILGDGPWQRPGIHDVVRADTDRVWRVSVNTVRERDLQVAVVHDVSAERRVARMKDDMLAVVSHELRTPLTPIKASAQLLRRRWERLPEAKRNELLEQIDRRADHLTRLIEDLLLVGQLSAGERAAPGIRLDGADLAAIVRDNVAQLALARSSHRICLTTPESLPTVTNQLRVRQVVDNLLDNACKFSPPGSPIEVTLAEVDGHAELRVRDLGRGIPPDELERVFERFQRVEDPMHMTTSGAGLGLYIVRALIEGLGGTITLDSVLGAGTTVTVRLPLRAAGA